MTTPSHTTSSSDTTTASNEANHNGATGSTKSEFERLQHLADRTLLAHKKPNQPPPKANKRQLTYDIIMLVVIVTDLLIISVDLILMSNFAAQIGIWLGFSDFLNYYVTHYHHKLSILGGFFTIFLIVELLIRWGLSIAHKEYMRWFFFPFVHWYEVLGCFPQLRALRLLRVIFIGRKLYEMGYQVLPEKWIVAVKFYYALILEELSDRVILTATDNIRQQFSGENTSQRLLAEILEKNRPALQSMLASMLKQELLPKLQTLHQGQLTKDLSTHVGASVQDALANTPELRRYLRMIPIAGGLIESQLHSIGQHIGENIINSLTTRLAHTSMTDHIIDNIAKNIAHIDLSNPELDALIISIVNDSLTAFEEQVKVQQWKHHQALQES